MNCGNCFVETLRKLGYPKAPKLDGEDFDWLFETTDDKAFLDWFCANVTEQNVLSDEKLQAFSTLKESGNTILDENALDEILQTCKPLHSKTDAMEEIEMGKLEEELEALQKLKHLHISRRNKIQMMAANNSHLCLKLKDKEEEEAKLLKENLSLLQASNKKLNHELQTVVEGVQKLIYFFAVPEAGTEFSSQPIFLSQIVLDKYLECENQSTAALTSFTKEHFIGLSKFMEDSEEKFELIQLKESTPSSNGDAREDKCQEMMRLQLAYICANNKLIQAKVKHAGLKAGQQWAEDIICNMQDKGAHKESLKARISSLKDEVSQIKNQIDLINRETLPDVIRENAQLLNMPIVKGDYDRQLARLKLYISRQDIVLNHLIKQKASSELLQLGHELELRKHRDVYRQLRQIIQELKLSNEKLDKRLHILSDPNLISVSTPRSNIDSKDIATHRLYQLLDDDKMQKLFRTYSGLESVAQKLAQDITSLKDQLVVSKQEQSIFQSKTDADLKSLGDFMYPEGKTLLLSTTELSCEFQHLDNHLEKLNHILVEVLGDLKIKKNILESNKLHKMEKQLYIYFFKNESYLRNIVENLESQADILSST
ncbi:HAUS augmin-like complex subunit 3 isoform 1-T2 [Discoglossus pictus]